MHKGKNYSSILRLVNAEFNMNLKWAGIVAQILQSIEYQHKPDCRPKQKVNIKTNLEIYQDQITKNHIEFLILMYQEGKSLQSLSKLMNLKFGVSFYSYTTIKRILINEIGECCSGFVRKRKLKQAS